MRNYSAGLTEGNWVSCTYVSEVIKKRGKAGKRLVEEMPPVSDSSDLMNLALKLPCDGYQSRPIDISLKKGVKATQPVAKTLFYLVYRAVAKKSNLFEPLCIKMMSHLKRLR